METNVQHFTAAELNSLLEPVTYRPDFTLSAHDSQQSEWWHMGSGACLMLGMQVVNTYHPEQPKMVLSMHQRLPSYIESAEDFYDFCLGMCLWFEEHEGREWFKIDGRPYRDPHALPTQQQFDTRQVFDRARALRPTPTPWVSMMISDYSDYKIADNMF